MTTTPEASVSTGSVEVETCQIGDGPDLAGWVRFNRPDDLNPMDWDTIKGLKAGFDTLAATEHVRVIFITGKGRAFSAGGDMKAYVALQRDRERFPQFVADCHRLFQGIATYPQPVVALVNGISAAGGTELIMFCDLAIAADSAKVGDAHLNFGMMGGGGVLAMLPLVVGPMRARELVLTGRFLSAAEAVDWGLVSRAVAADELEDAAHELAAQLAAKSPLAVKNAKSVLNEAFWSCADIATRMRLEREVDVLYCLTSADPQEGLAAFAEKRKPRFKGV